MSDIYFLGRHHLTGKERADCFAFCLFIMISCLFIMISCLFLMNTMCHSLFTFRPMIMIVYGLCLFYFFFFWDISLDMEKENRTKRSWDKTRYSRSWRFAILYIHQYVKLSIICSKDLLFYGLEQIVVTYRNIVPWDKRK